MGCLPISSLCVRALQGIQTEKTRYMHGRYIQLQRAFHSYSDMA